MQTAVIDGHVTDSVKSFHVAISFAQFSFDSIPSNTFKYTRNEHKYRFEFENIRICDSFETGCRFGYEVSISIPILWDF